MDENNTPMPEAEKTMAPETTEEAAPAEEATEEQA